MLASWRSSSPPSWPVRARDGLHGSAARLQGRLIAGDEGLRGRAADDLGEDIEREVLEVLEADARLAHVELLAGLRPGLAEPLLLVGIAVDEAQMERHVILLGGEAHVGERLAGVAVVAGGEHPMRHVVADHAVLHALLDALPVEVLDDDGAHGLERGAAVGGELAEVLLDGVGLALHGGGV